MKTKKLLSLVLCATMAFSMMSCGNKEANTDATKAPEATEAAATEAPSTSDEKVDLTYMMWGSDTEAANTQKTCDKFNAEQDKITVTAKAVPWETYMEKLSTMASAGELPDTALMNEAGCIKWAQQGMLADVSDMYAESDAKPLDSCTFKYNGTPVAYAVANNSLLLYYNKDMFDKAGVEYPPTTADKAWSWDQFVEAAKKLTLDKNGKTPNDAGFDKDNIKQYGCMVENLTWQLEVWCVSNGGGFYDTNGDKVTVGEDAATEAIQKVADLYLKDHVAPMSAGLTDDGVSRSLIAGNVAMTTNGAWNIGTCLKDARDKGLNYGIGILPYMKDKVTVVTGGPNVIFNQTKHLTESKEWIKWYSKEENNWDTLIAAGIWMPVLSKYYDNAADTDKWLKNDAYPEYAEAKAVLCDFVKTNAKSVSWYYTNNTGEFNTLLGTVLGDVWTGKTTAKEAIQGSLEQLETAHKGEQ